MTRSSPSCATTSRASPGGPSRSSSASASASGWECAWPRVTEQHAYLSDGTSLPASTVIATIGQRPVQVPGLDVHRDPRGRLVTRPDLSVVDGVWAAGDAACVVHPTSGEPVPANALWAIKGGEHVGRNLARSLRRRPTRPFTYRGLGQAASFGFGRSISELYGIPFTGWLAWVLRLTFFLRFMPSRRKAAQVVADFARHAAYGRRPADPAPTRDAVADLAAARPPDRRAAQGRLTPLRHACRTGTHGHADVCRELRHPSPAGGTQVASIASDPATAGGRRRTHARRLLARRHRR